MVGLGDRHSQNILVDRSTAELVHIDLGKRENKRKDIYLDTYYVEKEKEREHTELSLYA